MGSGGVQGAAFPEIQPRVGGWWSGMRVIPPARMACKRKALGSRIRCRRRRRRAGVARLPITFEATVMILLRAWMEVPQLGHRRAPGDHPQACRSRNCEHTLPATPFAAVSAGAPSPSVWRFVRRRPIPTRRRAGASGACLPWRRFDSGRDNRRESRHAGFLGRPPKCVKFTQRGYL